MVSVFRQWPSDLAVIAGFAWLRGGRAPPTFALSLEDRRLEAMSSSPFFGPNPCKYRVLFFVISKFPTIVSSLQ